ncbi:methylmalonyl-CoA mutase, partial [Salmonella sp. hn-f5]|nr:methylmalonyl-CoA mutase [Salmonella sp. hn-f5]
LKGGVIQPRIARARQVREAALSQGAAQIVGVTKYVDAEVRAAPVEGAEVAAASVQLVCEPLAPIRFAASFEEAGQ